MGLYYSAFIKEMKEQFGMFEGDLEEFLDQSQDIEEDFEITRGGLHWATNIEKFIEDLGEQIPDKYVDMINDPIEDNAKDWASE